MKARTIAFWFILTLIAAAVGLLLVSYVLALETVYTVVPFYVILLCPVVLSMVGNEQHADHLFFRSRGTNHHRYS